MRFRPIGAKVLVKKIKDSDQTSSGIYIADNAKDKPQRGEILALDNNITSSFKLNDIVVFSSFSGQEIEIDFEKYLILNLDDIFGILEKGI